MSERGPGRPRETSHDEIRRVALELFARNGYAATSLAQIARAAGISRTTLFAYFPSKRDLVWEEFDRRIADLDATLAGDSTPSSVTDFIVEAMLVNSRYRVDEHDGLARRMRLSEQDEALRAFMALTVQDLTDRISKAASRRASNVDPGLVDLVTHALVAAAARCTDEWAGLQRPTLDLAAYTAQRLQPIVEALRPLLG
jgi:TetR/AcrR family transcriptional regulator, regulator of mycofactocin system